MRLQLTLFVLIILSACADKKDTAEPIKSEQELEMEIHVFLDEWHQNAAKADTAYFDQIAENGIYIGTAKEELWTKEEFYGFAKRFFERESAWDFKATERHIYFSEDMEYVWFDELLDTWMGVCRASGVLRNTTEGWKIEHYHLSVAVPNEVIREVIETIEEFESNEQTGK